MIPWFVLFDQCITRDGHVKPAFKDQLLAGDLSNRPGRFNWTSADQVGRNAFDPRNGAFLPPGGRQNFEINPMKEDETRPGDLRRAPTCGARTRAGTPCQRSAIRGRKRCRLHGGLSPGAPRGARNGNFRNGDWTAEAIEERKWLRSLVQSFAKTGTTG
jgi:hypothetical protein